ncbi:MAG: hypothetical protein GY737_02765 [Desulfobacteraceae bacterium]|nr:hypothetical protein [Desulfobacteraceae bacterium]
MMLKILVLLVLFVFGSVSSAFACTSFALYGNEIFYGMNFDFTFLPLKFWIESNSGMKIFHMAFLYEPYIKNPEFGDYFANTCGMNDKGLFCACHEIEPYIEGVEEPNGDQIHIGDQYDTIGMYSDVKTVEKFISKKQAVQYTGPSLHNLFADTKGNAIVSETDNTENIIVDRNNDFLVMANFANHSMIGKHPDEAVGVGADRYKIAHEYLAKNKNNFNVDKGFELLGKAYSRDPGCITYCSMIFHPRTNSIYIGLNLNYERVWKVSLDSGVIETHRGYEIYRQTHLGTEGMLSADLESFGN